MMADVQHSEFALLIISLVFIHVKYKQKKYDCIQSLVTSQFSCMYFM